MIPGMPVNRSLPYNPYGQRPLTPMAPGRQPMILPGPMPGSMPMAGPWGAPPRMPGGMVMRPPFPPPMGMPGPYAQPLLPPPMMQPPFPQRNFPLPAMALPEPPLPPVLATPEENSAAPEPAPAAPPSPPPAMSLPEKTGGMSGTTKALLTVGGLGVAVGGGYLGGKKLGWWGGDQGGPKDTPANESTANNNASAASARIQADGDSSTSSVVMQAAQSNDAQKSGDSAVTKDAGPVSTVAVPISVSGVADSSSVGAQEGEVEAEAQKAEGSRLSRNQRLFAAATAAVGTAGFGGYKFLSGSPKQPVEKKDEPKKDTGMWSTLIGSLGAAAVWAGDKAGQAAPFIRTAATNPYVLGTTGAGAILLTLAWRRFRNSKSTAQVPAPTEQPKNNDWSKDFADAFTSVYTQQDPSSSVFATSSTQTQGSESHSKGAVVNTTEPPSSSPVVDADERQHEASETDNKTLEANKSLWRRFRNSRVVSFVFGKNSQSSVHKRVVAQELEGTSKATEAPPVNEKGSEAGVHASPEKINDASENETHQLDVTSVVAHQPPEYKGKSPLVVVDETPPTSEAPHGNSGEASSSQLLKGESTLEAPEVGEATTSEVIRDTSTLSSVDIEQKQSEADNDKGSLVETEKQSDAKASEGSEAPPIAPEDPPEADNKGSSPLVKTGAPHGNSGEASSSQLLKGESTSVHKVDLNAAASNQVGPSKPLLEAPNKESASSSGTDAPKKTPPKYASFEEFFGVTSSTAEPSKSPSENGQASEAEADAAAQKK